MTTINQNPDPYQQRQVTLSFLCNRVRRFMRDHRELNRLIAGEENSDEDICLALDMLFSDFNSSPPFIGAYNYKRPPPFHLTIIGCVYFLLQSKGLLESRNALNFNDGGISIAADKDGRTQSWIAQFQNKYENDKLQYKKSENIEAAWNNSLQSEYSIVNNVGWFSIYG